MDRYFFLDASSLGRAQSILAWGAVEFRWFGDRAALKGVFERWTKNETLKLGMP